MTSSEPSNEAQLQRYCGRCHRKLKSEASMKAGFGPVCAKKELAKKVQIEEVV